MKAHIRPLLLGDEKTWLEMRSQLWPEYTMAELQEDQLRIQSAPSRNAVFVAENSAGIPIGFVEVSIRDWAEGCRTEPVGYLEGWYVLTEYRQQGIGKELVEAAENWAIAKGCSEMASDTERQNQLSRDAHKALGYREVAEVVSFCKPLK
jgi:aminoglycoside 6'-N-acetyltransferase I